MIADHIECPFIELSMPCTDVTAMETFWSHYFGGEVIFRGRMLGQPFSRMLVCGVTLVFREDPDYAPPPGPGQEFMFRDHLGFRVRDLDESIAALEALGAQFVLTPERVKALQQMRDDDGDPFLQTDYAKAPLTTERLAQGEFKTRVAIMVGPDNIWVELNEIREPADARWFPAPHLG